MYKSKVLVVAMFLFGMAAMVSCEKDNPRVNTPEPIIVNHDKAEVTVTISWDSWGLKKYDCKKGFGLCNFKISIESVGLEEAKTAPVLFDSNGRPYVIILVDADVEFENDEREFLVEEDISSVSPEGETYTMPSGVYHFNPEFGEMGGFVVPLIIR